MHGWQASVSGMDKDVEDKIAQWINGYKVNSKKKHILYELAVKNNKLPSSATPS